MRSLFVFPLLIVLPLGARADHDLQGPGRELFPFPSVPLPQVPIPPPPESNPDVIGEPPLPPDDVDITGPAPRSALPPPQPISIEIIERELLPYGRFWPSPDYGRVWVPNTVPADWQPYTEGRWASTELGWSFSSTAPWALTFHHGRWGYDASTVGWYWVPGTEWAPAWVTWRTTGEYVAWAPLGPKRARSAPDWHGWAAIHIRHMGHPLRNHLVPGPYLSRIVREGRPVADINTVVPPPPQPGPPPRSYGRRPYPYGHLPNPPPPPTR